MPPVASGCRHAILLLLWAAAAHGKTVACPLLTLALVVCLSLQLVLFFTRTRSLLSCTPLIYKRAATARPRYCNIAIHSSAGSRVLACSNRAHRLKLESGFWILEGASLCCVCRPLVQGYRGWPQGRPALPRLSGSSGGARSFYCAGAPPSGGSFLAMSTRSLRSMAPRRSAPRACRQCAEHASVGIAENIIEFGWLQKAPAGAPARQGCFALPLAWSQTFRSCVPMCSKSAGA